MQDKLQEWGNINKLSDVELKTSCRSVSFLEETEGRDIPFNLFGDQRPEGAVESSTGGTEEGVKCSPEFPCRQYSECKICTTALVILGLEEKYSIAKFSNLELRQLIKKTERDLKEKVEELEAIRALAQSPKRKVARGYKK